jgi:RHS repeat-associated protein
VSYTEGTPDSQDPNVIPAPTRQQQWELDKLGNWKSFVETSGGATITQTRAHNKVNELRSITTGPTTKTLKYDPAGNLKDDEQFHYKYDEEQRLKAVFTSVVDPITGNRVAGTAVARYKYDALGRRILKRLLNPDGTTQPVTRFYYDGDRVVEERTGGQNLPSRQYIWGNYVDELLISDTVDAFGNVVLASRLYALQNSTYSVHALVNDAGAVVERYSYTPYGEVTVLTPAGSPLVASLFGNVYTFTGRELDGETGTYNFRRRTYSPKLGRFLQRDSKFRDGMNLYEFARSRATVARDPSGRELVMRDWKSALAFNKRIEKYGASPSYSLILDLPPELVRAQTLRINESGEVEAAEPSDGDRWDQPAIPNRAESVTFIKLADGRFLIRAVSRRHMAFFGRLEGAAERAGDGLVSLALYGLNATDVNHEVFVDDAGTLTIVATDRIADPPSFGSTHQIRRTIRKRSAVEKSRYAIVEEAGGSVWILIAADLTGASSLFIAFEGEDAATLQKYSGGERVFHFALGSTQMVLTATGVQTLGQVGISGGRALAGAMTRSGSEPLIHFTTQAGKAGIEASGQLVGRHGIFAVPQGAAAESLAWQVARTGLRPSGLTNYVRIPEAATQLFSRPLPLGPYSLFRYLGGVRFAAPGSINMATGAFAPAAAWVGPKVLIYTPDVIFYAFAGSAYAYARTR